MSESTFVLFHQFVIGAENLLYAICMAGFFQPFMARKKRSAIVLLTYGILYPLLLIPFVRGWLHKEHVQPAVDKGKHADRIQNTVSQKNDNRTLLSDHKGPKETCHTDCI